MPLDSLAPDQRAVVQLVLQQGRSYGDLAGLLGIPEEAVRDRAHAGIAALAPGAAPAGSGDVADYLLGQQGDAEREATRSMLASDPAARDWAQAVADQLSDVATHLPEIPGSPTQPAAPPDESPQGEAAVAPTATPEPAAAPRPRPRPRPLRDDEQPLPRRSQRATPTAATSAEGDRPTASRLGGALLIGGLAILVAAILIFVVNGGDDDEPTTPGSTTGTNAQASPTATATPQALGQIPLQKVGDQTGRGVMALFGQAGQGLVFTLAAERVPALEQGEAYAMWFTDDQGGSQLLGFFTEGPQGNRRQLATSGPRDEDAARFAQWLGEYDHIVVSKETVNRPESPTTIVLQGDLPPAEGEE